jgi:hypothetical protein
MSAKGAFMSAVDSKFQRDVFQLRPVILAVGETYHVLDEQGTLLLQVVSPNRIIRLVTTPILAVAVFLLVSFCLGMVSTTIAQRAGRDLFTPLFLCGLILSGLAGGLASIWLVLQLLARKAFRFSTEAEKDSPFLELRPRSQHLGLGTIYELWDSQTGLLATLRTNLVAHVLFRRYWLGAHPDGSFWFIARENTAVPRVLRQAMRTGVGLLLLAGILIGLIAAIIGLITVAPTGSRLLIYLAILVPLAMLYLVVSVAAFVLRKLLPDCSILGPDRQALLGTLKRQPCTGGPNVLDMVADRERVLDRRVAVALGVLLAEGV